MLCALVVACTAPPTEVVLWFDAERSIRDEIATVRVTVESEGVMRTAFERPFAPAQGEPKLVLAPLNDDARRRFSVRAEARGRDATLVARVELHSGYIARTSLYGRVIFSAACPTDVLEPDPESLGRVQSRPSELHPCEHRTAEDASPGAADSGAEDAGDGPPLEAMDASFESRPAPDGSACAQGETFDAGRCWSTSPCGTPDSPCGCDAGSILGDGGCRSPTACDEAGDRCEDDCELDGESHRCVCTDGGAAKPETDGQCWHWQKAVPVEQGNGDVVSSNLAMNPDGTAVAIWFEKHCPLPGCGSDVEVQLWANRHTFGTGWSEPQRLRVLDEPSISGFTPLEGAPAVAVDNAGNALALWQEDPAGDAPPELRAALLPAESWGTAIEEPSPGDVLGWNTMIERDPTGGLYVASTDGESGDNPRWWLRRFTREAGWESTIVLAQPEEALLGLSFTVGTTGDLSLLWKHATGTILASRLQPMAPADMTKMEIVDSARARDSVDLDIAVNARGDALGVWLQASQDDTSSDLYWTETYDDAAWWWEARLRARDVANLFNHPRVTFDGSNRATVLWVQREGSSTRVYARSGEQPPVLIDLPDVGDSHHGALAGDAHGHVNAIWSRSANYENDRLWTSRLTDADWSAPLQLESGPGAATWPHIAVAANGDTLVTWQHAQDGRVELRSRTFD